MGALAVLIVVGNLPGRKLQDEPPGVTTETAMLLMFVVGACLSADFVELAIAVTGIVAVLLHLKPEMHALAAKMGERASRCKVLGFIAAKFRRPP